MAQGTGTGLGARQARALDFGEAFLRKWKNRSELVLHWAEAELEPALPRERVDELVSKPWEDGSVGHTMHATLYVALCARLGRMERAMEVIGDTLSAIERSDERWLEPELYRLRGELLRARGDSAEAAQSMAKAIAIAKDQGSRSLELRATLGLHTLVAGVKKKRAREDVARLLTLVTEGHDTPDLVEARAVVES